MKNLTLSIALAVIAIFSMNEANAQSGGVRFGIKAGVALTTLGSATSNGVSINYGYRSGFQGGFFLDAPLSGGVSFNPQILYSQKGGSVNTTIGSTTLDGYTQLNYLDVPFLFGFKANPKLAFYVGPQVAFLLSQTTQLNASGFGSGTSTDKSASNSTVFGGNLGAGYSLSNDVGINLHYIFDFQKAKKSQYTTGERNSGFALTLAFKF